MYVLVKRHSRLGLTAGDAGATQRKPQPNKTPGKSTSWRILTSFCFQWDDPFLLADQLSEDERLIAETARAYAQDKLQPRIVEAYMEEKTDRAIFEEMGGLGLLGVTISDAFGGAGAGYVSYGLVAREVERVDFGLSLDDERAVLAGDVSDRGLWLRSAKARNICPNSPPANGSAASA